MNKYIILIVILAMSMFVGIPVQAQDTVVKEVSVQDPVMPVTEQNLDFTKIEISPQYSNLRLQPGESKETTVTVRNKEKKSVSLKANIVLQPYGGYMVDPEWITVTPSGADVPAGGSQKFTVKTSVPADASTGNSGFQIAFTDEVMPTSYPAPVPSYIHAFQLSIEVWTTPKIQIITSYISDQIEAGKVYDYEIKLKNTGDQSISISPKLGNDNMFYGPYGMTTPVIPDDAITITAPQSVPAGDTVTVKIHVEIPAGARGYYNGYIDLGIDDPSVREWEGRVNLNFNMWKQPSEAFVKTFSVKEPAPITIEVSSSNYYVLPMVKGEGANAKEPSFETSLTGPGGKADLKVKRTVIKGNINMGGDRPPWEIDSESIYQATGIQYVEIYTTDGSIGEWKLSVLPRNTQGFDYTITIGE